MAGLLGSGASSTSTGGGLLFAANEKREKERVDAFQGSLHTSSQQAIDAVKANMPELIPYTPAQVETEPVKEKKGALKWLGDNLMSGLGQGNKAFYGVLQSIGGDKIPGVSKALDTAVKVSERDISKGGTDIGSQLIQAVPNAATSLGMAAMTGGASLAPQLGKSVTQQAIQTTLRNPMFYNSLLRSYGGAYNEAREAGQDRGTAITAGLLTGIPEAVIEQSGGIEQVFKRPAKGLLPAIGRTALEEAAEEIAQYPFGGAVKKALYAPETPVYSTTEEAVINPAEMGKGAFIGGVMGGLMGGVGKVMTGDVGIKPVQQTDIEYQAETPRSPAIYGEPIQQTQQRLFAGDTQQEVQPMFRTEQEVQQPQQQRASLSEKTTDSVEKPHNGITTFYTGSSNPNITEFKPGGDGSTKQSGDSFGVGVYLTDNPDVAKLYAQGDNGKVYTVTTDNNLLNLNEKANTEFAKTVSESISDAPKQYRNRILRDIGRTEKSFSDATIAEAFYDKATDVWESEDGEYFGNKPYVRKQGNTFIIKYTDFNGDIQKLLTDSTNEQIFKAIAAINTNEASGLVMASGYDGIIYKDGGAFNGGVEGNTAVIYKNTKNIKQTAQPTAQQAAPIGGDIKQDAQPMLYTGDTQQETRPMFRTQQEAAPSAEARITGDIPQGEKLLSFPQTMQKSDTTAVELKQMIKDNPLSYKPINNADTLKYAQGIVDQDFEAAKRVVLEGDSYSNEVESAMAMDIIRRLQNEKQWDSAFEVMESHSKKAKKSGQIVQTNAMWNRMTPEGMLKYAHRVINQANEAGVKNAKMTPEFAAQLTDSMKRLESITDPVQLQNLIKEQAGKMPRWAENMISEKTTGQLKEIATTQVLSSIAKQIPTSAWKKVSAVQAMSHLINVKTALRNVVGNTAFGTLEKVSNIAAAPIDMVAERFTGQRSLTLPQTGKESMQAGFARAKESALDVALGINRSGISEGKYNVPQGKIFDRGIGRAAEKVLGYELNVPDEFFKGEVYHDVLHQQMKIEGVDTPTQAMMEYAEYRARYATFQDDSLPARLLQGLKDLANKIGGGQEFTGKSGLKTREFGTGDLLTKYTTVPGNLISRSIEYSPAGLFRILSLATDAKMSGKVKQSEISMTIGRSLVGTTSMIGMGALLKHFKLLISEDRERGRNATALDRTEGLGNYKVNLSALGRLIDSEDASPQHGDKLYSYNWIEPVGAMLAVGATVYDEVHKDGTIPEIAFNSANAAMEEILDLPTLSVIRQMTYQDNVFDIAITPFVQGVSGFIPGPVRQTAQMLDPVARDTKGATPIETIGKRIQTSVPVWREGLEPKIAPFGEEIEYPTSVWNSLMNPGQASIYTPSNVTADLKTIEDITGGEEHYPRDRAPNSFNYNKKTIELTPEEKTLYMRVQGEEVLRLFELQLSQGVNEANANSKSKALVKAKSKAHDKAKRAILKQRGIIR